jgi:hypothetical protein
MNKPKILKKGDPETIKYMNYVRSLKHGGSAKNAGYVRKMEAESKLLLHKVTNPSKHLQNKYGNQQQQEPQPIFDQQDNLDFNVAKPKKKKVTKTKQLTEAEEDRINEERVNKINKLESLKAQLVECRKELGKENSTYMDVLDEVRNRKKLKQTDRTNLEQAVRSKYVKNIDKIKAKYKDVFQFISNNKLNDDDLNSVHKYINDKMKSL